MLNLSVIILTYNEELHIRRCLENVKSIAKEIYIIDSFSTDATLDIAREFDNVHILQNKWENNYAKQFNWGLEHSGISTQWVLRLDADEYLLPELIDEVQNRLGTLPPEITGVLLRRRHIFLGKWVRHGIYPVRLLRLFRTGTAESRQRLMDEKLILLKGQSVEFEHDFVDHNLNDLSWWTRKHDGYALREAADLLMANDATSKKRLYRCLPLFWRAAAYFFYRYILRLGFLDGREGFLWHFLQGWWYRTLVDAKVLALQKACGGGGGKPSNADLRNYLRTKGILLPDEH